MKDVMIDVYSLKRGLVKRSVDRVTACILLEMNALRYGLEVIKTLCVLLRSQLFKGVKNSDYYVNGGGNISIDEGAYEALGLQDRNLIYRALEETKGVVVLSGEGTVDLFYTANCGGGTANSEDILGHRLNYLRRVLCRYCGECQKEKVLSLEDIKQRVEGRTIIYKDEIDNIFKNAKRDETGRILEIDVFGKIMSGEEFMKTFEIDSNRVFFTEDSIKLKICGEGSGLGICLKGADALAQQGMKYTDIISYYYTGITFKKLDEQDVQRLLAGRTILIDPGHGGSDAGNVYLNIVEKDVNLKITLALKAMLEKTGARVILTRGVDEEVVLGERVMLINNERPNFFISIHQNSMPSPGVNGVEAYCYAGDKEATKLGEVVLKSISDELGIKNRGVRTGDYYLLRETRVSGIILETMYLTGKLDSSKYSEENYALIAGAIFKAICRYYDIEV